MNTANETRCDWEKHVKAYADHELGVIARLGMSRHLATCGRCQKDLAFMKIVEDNVKEWNGAAPPEGLREKILAALPDGPSSKPRASLLIRPFRLSLTVLASACAVVLLAAVIFPLFATAREKARQVSSESDMKQLGLSVASDGGGLDIGRSTGGPADASSGLSAIDGRTLSAAPSNASAQPPSLVAESQSGTNNVAVNVPPFEPTDISSLAALQNHQIIYTAQADLVVKQLNEAEQNLTRLVAFRGGYISSKDVGGDAGSPRTGTWEVRVPVGNFQPFMDEVSHLGELKNVQVSSQDVTEQYTDLNAQLSNKQIEEQRLLTLLENRTARLTDILRVEQEVTRVRGEIEELQGQIRYMKHSADYSTVTISITEVANFIPPKTASFGDQIGRTFTGAVGQVSDTGKAIVYFFVGLAPWLAALALPVALVWMVARRALARIKPA